MNKNYSHVSSLEPEPTQHRRHRRHLDTVSNPEPTTAYTGRSKRYDLKESLPPLSKSSSGTLLPMVVKIKPPTFPLPSASAHHHRDHYTTPRRMGVQTQCSVPITVPNPTLHKNFTANTIKVEKGEDIITNVVDVSNNGKKKMVHVCPCHICIRSRLRVWENCVTALRFRQEHPYFYYGPSNGIGGKKSQEPTNSSNLFKAIPRCNKSVFGREGGSLGIFTTHVAIRKHWENVAANHHRHHLNARQHKCPFDSCYVTIPEGQFEEHLLSCHFDNITYFSISTPAAGRQELFLSPKSERVFVLNKFQNNRKRFPKSALSCSPEDIAVMMPTPKYTTSLAYNFVHPPPPSDTKKKDDRREIIPGAPKKRIFYDFDQDELTEVARTRELCKYFKFLHNHLLCLHKGTPLTPPSSNLSCSRRFSCEEDEEIIKVFPSVEAKREYLEFIEEARMTLCVM